MRNDRIAADEVAELLDGVTGLAVQAVGELRAGQVEPRPAGCSSGRGCANPAICRCDP
ncbi:unannotated protein [freshwater metagenome]|uniref:Unannotated protein n=1 Tax=freshwater metagenome TaxID=449393 RepID=A0A6J7ENW1_9ZZZZ